MNTNHPKSKIGLFVCVCLVAGNLIGSGIYVLPIYLANYGLQGISIWVVAALSAIVLAVVFSRLSWVFPASVGGGPYLFAKKSYGPMVGFLVGWSYWISVWTGIAVIAITFASYAVGILPFLGDYVSETAVAVVWILILTNLAGIYFGVMVQSVLFIGKMLPLAAIIFFAFPQTDFSNIVTVTPLFNLTTLEFQWRLILIAYVAVWWGFLGIESATMVAQHVKNPRRTLPLATIIGVLIPTVTYCLITIVTLGNLPTDQLVSTGAPLADLGVKLWGRFGITFVTIGALTACLGTLNGWIIIQGQIIASMAHDRLLPNFLDYRNRNDAPVPTYILTGLSITSIIYLTRDLDFIRIFEFISLVSVLTCFLSYIFCSYAELTYRAKQRTVGEAHWLLHLLSAVAFISCLLGIVATNQEVVLCSFMLVLLGIPFYAYGQIEKKSSMTLD